MKRKTLLSALIAVLVSVLAVTSSACVFGNAKVTLENDGVVVSGRFGADATLVSRTVELESEEGAKVLATIAERGYGENSKIYVFDISVESNGEKVKPDGKVTITVPMTTDADANEYTVLHLTDGDRTEKITPTVKSDKIIFKTSSFSYFVIIEKEIAKYNFAASVYEGKGGKITEDGTEVNFGDGREVVEGTEITLKAVADEGYVFDGWYNGEEKIAADAETTFKVEQNTSVYAKFTAQLTSFGLDARAAGFTYDGDTLTTTIVTIGSESLPDPSAVLVKAVYADGNVVDLTADDYTIDLGGLDFNAVGDYTVTYTYNDNSDLNATLSVRVVKGSYEFRADTSGNGKIYYEDTEQPSGYVATLEAGSKVTLKAVASEGNEFKGWYLTADKSGELVSTSAEYEFTVGNGNYTVYAVFEEIEPNIYKFAASVYGGKGGKITEDGAEVNFGDGRNVVEGTEISLKAVADEGYVFDGWYNGDEKVADTAEKTFKVEQNTSVYAKFTAQVTSLGLDARAAGFTYNGDTLTTTIIAVGSETLPDPSAVLVKAVYADGNVVDLTADDYTIDLGGLDFNAVGDYTVTYTYKANNALKATLKVQIVKGSYEFRANTSGNGKIYHEDTEQPSGYVATLEAGSKVTLKAVANEGNKFKGWYLTEDKSGDPVSTSAEYEFTMGGSAYTVYAVFEEISKYNFAASVYGGKGGKITENGTAVNFGDGREVLEGTEITLKAVADEGYIFDGWYDGDGKVADTAEKTFKVEQNTSVYAKFTAQVTSVRLDARNAGFTYDGDSLTTTVVTVGNTNLPNPSAVLVKAVYADGNSVNLTTEEYTIDLGGLDFNAVGTYTVTYTYKANNALKATLKVQVVNRKYEFRAKTSGNGKIYREKIEYPNGYFATLEASSKVTLMAKPNEDSRFKGWYLTADKSGDPVSTSAEYEFTIGDSDYTVYAVFEDVTKYNFVASVYGDKGGKITENGTEVNFGNGRRVLEGTEITVKAVADEGYIFDGWYDGDGKVADTAEKTFKVEQNISVYAKFTAQVTSLSLDARNAGFTYDGDSLTTTVVTVGSTSQPNPSAVLVKAIYADGNSVDLTAEEYTIDLGGLDFNAVGTYTVTYTYKANTAIKITVKIQVIGKPYTLNVNYSKSVGDFIYDGSKQTDSFFKQIPAGSQVTLKFVAKDGFEFSGWAEQDGTIVSTEEEYTFEMPAKEYELTVKYETLGSFYIQSFYVHDGVGEGNGRCTLYKDGVELDETTVRIYAKSGTKVTIRVKPDPGFKLKEISRYMKVEGKYQYVVISNEETYTFTIEDDSYTIHIIMTPLVCQLKFDDAAAQEVGFIDGTLQYAIGDGKIPYEQLVVNGVYGDNTTSALTASDYTVDDSRVNLNAEGTYTVDFKYNEDTSVVESLTVTVIDPATVQVEYSKSSKTNLSQHAYNGKAVFISREDITVNGMTLDTITCRTILNNITWEWRDVTRNEVVDTEDVDVTVNGVKIKNYGPTNYKRTVGGEICGPATAGDYKFTLWYNGAEIFTETAKITEETFEKITTADEFTSNIGSIWVNFKLNYYTIVGEAEGKLYVMQMPKIDNTRSGNVEAEARLVTPDANGKISLGAQLDFVFVKILYYANQKNTVEFVTGYYGSYVDYSSASSITGSFGDPYIYRTGFTILSGKYGVVRCTGNKGNPGMVTEFSETDGSVTLYSSNYYLFETEKDRLRLVKDGDKFVFTSVNTDKDTRTSYPIYIYKHEATYD